MSTGCIHMVSGVVAALAEFTLKKVRSSITCGIAHEFRRRIHRMHLYLYSCNNFLVWLLEFNFLVSPQKNNNTTINHMDMACQRRTIRELQPFDYSAFFVVGFAAVTFRSVCAGRRTLCGV